MGSIKRHRKVYSDIDSFQYKYVPGGGESMTFGDRAIGRFGKGNVHDLKTGIDYDYPEDFYVVDDTVTFLGPVKA